mgnify:CR=1 FL=1
MKLKLLASVAAAGLFAAGAASAEPNGWYGAIDAGYHMIDDINAESSTTGANWNWEVNDGWAAFARLGYRFNPKLETRLYIRYREEYHENSGTLTLAQLKKNSKQTNAATYATRGDSTKRGSTWVGSKTTYTFDDDATLEAGLVYHNYPQILSRKSTVNPNYWDWRDINYSLKYSRTDQLFGLPSTTTAGWSSTQHIRSGARTYKGDKDLGILQKQVEYDGSFDHVFTLGNDLGLTDNLYLATGVSAIEIKRDINVTYSDRPNTSGLPSHYKYDEWKLAPRIGLRYYIAPDVQLFANASRTIDPPSSWSSSGSGVTSNYAKPLVPQAANTVEFGIKGKSGIFDGSLAFYKSWIKNELLNVEVLPATSTSAAVVSTSNATRITPKGIRGSADVEGLLAFLDSTVTAFDPVRGRDDDPVSGSVSLSGSRAAMTPNAPSVSVT